jgi:hypothetical protein
VGPTFADGSSARRSVDTEFSSCCKGFRLDDRSQASCERYIAKLPPDAPHNAPRDAPLAEFTAVSDDVDAVVVRDVWHEAVSAPGWQ